MNLEIIINMYNNGSKGSIFFIKLLKLNSSFKIKIKTIYQIIMISYNPIKILIEISLLQFFIIGFLLKISTLSLHL